MNILSLIQGGHAMVTLPRENQTVVEFVLKGFSSIQELNIFLFMMFLVSYILIISGKHPHCPASFIQPSPPHPHVLLSVNLSFLEMWYTSSIVLKMLLIILGRKKTIAVAGCLAQFYLAPWLQQSASCSRWCPMTATWPSASLSTIPFSWLAPSALGWLPALGSAASFSQQSRWSYCLD